MRTFLRLVLAKSSACPACVHPWKDRGDVWQSSFISLLDCHRSALTWCERVSLWHIINEMQRKACHHLINTSAYEKCLLPSPQTPSLHLGMWNITFHVFCAAPEPFLCFSEARVQLKEPVAVGQSQAHGLTWPASFLRCVKFLLTWPWPSVQIFKWCWCFSLTWKPLIDMVRSLVSTLLE